MLSNLLPARTDTKWFHTYAEWYYYPLFLRGRLTFKGAPAPAPFPSLLLVSDRKWLDRFADVGVCCAS